MNGTTPMLWLQVISCNIQAAISDNEKSPTLCSFGIVTFQSPQVKLLFIENGFSEVQVFKDFSGIGRFTIGRYK